MVEENGTQQIGQHDSTSMVGNYRRSRVFDLKPGWFDLLFLDPGSIGRRSLEEAGSLKDPASCF